MTSVQVTDMTEPSHKAMESVRLDCRPSVCGTSSTEKRNSTSRTSLFLLHLTGAPSHWRFIPQVLQPTGAPSNGCSIPQVQMIWPIFGLTPVASIQSPALPLSEAAEFGFLPCDSCICLASLGWLETPRAPAVHPTGECDGDLGAESLLLFTS